MSHQLVARQVSSKVYHQHHRAIETLLEARLVQQQRAEQTEAAQDTLQRRRRHVAEEILTMKCEHCRTAWLGSLAQHCE